MQKEKDCFTEQAKIFYEEMREESLLNLRSENTKYDELRKNHAEISDEKDIVLKEMPQKDRDIINEFIDQVFNIHIIEQQHIYLQGYRDCIKFLKLIRVFHD